jgi:hypothetical protein
LLRGKYPVSIARVKQAPRIVRLYPYGIMVLGLVVLGVKGDWVDAGVVLAALIALALSLRAVRRDQTVDRLEPGTGPALISGGKPARRPTPPAVWAYMAIVWVGFAVIWLTATGRPIGRVLAAGCGAVALPFLVISIRRRKTQRQPNR